MQRLDKKEAGERILTGLLFAGIFLPVRLLFYNYVSDHWLGSFGLMTGVLLALLYLSEKGRLGYAGYLVKKHVQKFSTGKLGKISMVSSVFILYFFGNMIYGIENAPIIPRMAISAELEREGIRDIADVEEHSRGRSMDAPSILLGMLFLLLPNPGAHAVFSVVNDLSDGWVLHFSTVFFVEQLEILGLVVYFRYLKKPKY